MERLDNIAIVLVETQSAGNIGSAARAMKNMGLAQMILVNCQTDLTDEAYHLACGAEDILKHCQHFQSLQDAVSSFNLSIGTSSRLVHWIPTVYRPLEMAEKIVQLPDNQRIALVFGPERTGLTNEHLSRCQWLVTIPSNPAFESMNLSHAVAIVSYEIYQKAVLSRLGRTLERASIGQIEAFFRDLSRALDEIGFLKEDNPERLMATIRQIFSRASLEERDVRILRGILRQWNWYARQLRKSARAEKQTYQPDCTQPEKQL